MNTQGGQAMRYESSIASVSWIPSEAIPTIARLPFDLGPFHYDDPPPDQLHDIPALARSGAVRFINEMRAWVEIENGRIVRHGQSGRGWMGRTKLGLGSHRILYPTIGMPDLRSEPQVGPHSVRFLQTTGGRPALPLPRKLNRPPFLQIIPPIVWTTLALSLHADGTASHEVVGASPFPRHWIYDDAGRLIKKVAMTDFRSWSGDIFGERTPWGREDSPAVVSQVETALERQLSETIMRGGARPKIRTLDPGATLVEQGAAGQELFLLLDGLLAVEVDGNALAEVGPGAILGERAILEQGRRTATLRARTRVRVAVTAADTIEPQALTEVAAGHRREEQS